MRPGRSIIVAAVVLTAAAAGAGAYIARSGSHPSAASPPSASVAPTSTAPTAIQGRPSVTRSTGSEAPTAQPTRTTSPLADRISDPQVAADRLVAAWVRGDRVAARNLAGGAVTDRLFSESPPSQSPEALPCRLADPAVFVCSYPIAERAELTILVEGGASAGYGVSGVEFGD
jgi:hypothetical protein